MRSTNKPNYKQNLKKKKKFKKKHQINYKCRHRVQNRDQEKERVNQSVEEMTMGLKFWRSGGGILDWALNIERVREEETEMERQRDGELVWWC